MALQTKAAGTARKQNAVEGSRTGLKKLWNFTKWTTTYRIDHSIIRTITKQAVDLLTSSVGVEVLLNTMCLLQKLFK